MPRKTKIQLEEERLAAEAERARQEEIEYKERLMPALASACEVGYTLHVDKEGHFILRIDTDYPCAWSSRSGAIKLTQDYSKDVYYRLSNLENDIGAIIAYKEEQKRKKEMRKEALAKLSNEEKELLGLDPY